MWGPFNFASLRVINLCPTNLLNLVDLFWWMPVDFKQVAHRTELLSFLLSAFTWEASPQSLHFLLIL